MIEDTFPFGSRAYVLMVCLLVFARGADFVSTWVATPNLTLEGNPIAKKLGWKWGILLNAVIVMLLAAPALSLKTGPPSAEQLPTSNPAREEAGLIADSIGPGWEAPFVLVAVSNKGPINEPDSLAALIWSRSVSRPAWLGQAEMSPA